MNKCLLTSESGNKSKSTEVMLPIVSAPMIRSYRIHAYLFSIIMCAHSDFYEYAISNYLCLHNKRSEVDYLDFHVDNYFQGLSSLFHDNSWFDFYQIDVTSTAGENMDYIKQVIIDGLKNGYYVIHCINESYLKHTVYYGGDICNNLEMTFGFSEIKDVFYVLDYNKYGNFGGEAVSSNDYIRAILTTTIQKKYLNFIRAKNNLTFKLDIEKAVKLLRCHISSKPAYSYTAYAGNLIGYKAVNHTLDTFKNSGIDFIKMRTIKEHKDMVFRYFKYICDSGMTSPSFFERYLHISKRMDNIFLCSIKDIITNASINTERIDLIAELNKRESQCIIDYLNDDGIL